jgi:ubiquinone biosynthesis protein Coq4
MSTLRAELNKIYASPNAFTRDNLSPQGWKYVYAHDTTHLIFGCDTSKTGEFRVEY